MHIHTHGCHTMMTKTNKTTNFEPVSFITRFILFSKPTHQYNFFLLASFFQAGEQNNQP